MESGSAPGNSEAYAWYLRSLSMAHEAGRIREAIKMLEKAVALDPNYAPGGKRSDGAIILTRSTGTVGMPNTNGRMRRIDGRSVWNQDALLRQDF